MPSFAKDNTSIDFPNILSLIRKMSRAKRTIISEIIILVKLILLAPATNAEGERIFSGLRRVKTYLRSTMGNIRLGNIRLNDLI